MERTDTVSLGSSSAGDRGRGMHDTSLKSKADKALATLLLDECKLGVVGSGGASLKRLSMYAGLMLAVDGRGRAMAMIMCWRPVL